MLPREDNEGESGEFKVLQGKVGDLAIDVGTLDDLKASKGEVADAVVDAASVIGQ